MSAYRTAIDQTTAVVDRRVKYFRNQIIIVVAIMAFVALAAVFWSAALWAWLLLVPACGFFFHADLRLLNRWRSDVLQPWVAREMDLVAWSQAIRANPVLPKETTGAMLATLPMASDLIAERKILTPTRQAIAAVCLSWNGAKSDALLLNAITSAVVVALLIAALWMHRWTPLLGLTVLVLYPLGLAWITRRWQNRRETEVEVCRMQPGFNQQDYDRIRASIT